MKQNLINPFKSPIFYTQNFMKYGFELQILLWLGSWASLVNSIVEILTFSFITTNIDIQVNAFVNKQLWEKNYAKPNIDRQ